MKSPGISIVDEGFATGYILNALHNILIWEKGRWRFQIEGPFVVSSRVPQAHALYQTFEKTTLPGHGVITLMETSHAWTATVNYLVQAQPSHRYEEASFPVAWSNMDLVKVILQNLVDSPTIRHHSMTCVIGLSIQHLNLFDKVGRCY